MNQHQPFGDDPTHSFSERLEDVPEVLKNAERIESREEFMRELTRYIEQHLVKSPGSSDSGTVLVERDTLLFESGLIDSMAILQLLGFIELATGSEIPDRKVTLENVRTVEAITDAFWES